LPAHTAAKCDCGRGFAQTSLKKLTAPPVPVAGGKRVTAPSVKTFTKTSSLLSAFGFGLDCPPFEPQTADRNSNFGLHRWFRGGEEKRR